MTSTPVTKESMSWGQKAHARGTASDFVWVTPKGVFSVTAPLSPGTDAPDSQDARSALRRIALECCHLNKSSLTHCHLVTRGKEVAGQRTVERFSGCLSVSQSREKRDTPPQPWLLGFTLWQQIVPSQNSNNKSKVLSSVKGMS